MQIDLSMRREEKMPLKVLKITTSIIIKTRNKNPSNPS